MHRRRAIKVHHSIELVQPAWSRRKAHDLIVGLAQPPAPVTGEALPRVLRVNHAAQLDLMLAANHWTTSIDRVSGDALKTVFSVFGIIYLFWPSGDAYFLLHQPKRYSILFLLRI